MKYVIAALSMTSTWAGFETYHLMREAEFLSLTAIMYGGCSVALILFGSFLSKIAVGDK